MDVDAAIADIGDVLAHGGLGYSGTSHIATASARYYACICRYCPPGSPYRQLAELHRDRSYDGNPPPHMGLKGVLTSLGQDIRKGKLAVFEELVRADVYADLLAQADGLHRDRYSRAATVLAGAALEEHLKKLATKAQIPLQTAKGDAKKASVINSELKASGLYGEAQRATVEGWQKLRNDAAHGDPGFDGEDTRLVGSVAPMIQGVRAFIAQYVA